ncbi:hypothetical protein BGZ73_006895 [Actinomortierella ambigua]|nr:hypothetical protein BGZ73_006895 [Actinomortierella ambigua]
MSHAQWSLNDHHRRVCQLPLPRLPRLGPKARDYGVYISGALFALGWWFFIDAAVYSKNWDLDRDGVKRTSVAFEDWVPGICSTLGMIVINAIDKGALRDDGYSYSSGSIAWKARLFLFIGFALMAGGLAGSVTVLCIKYIVPQYGDPFVTWGIYNVVQNASIMISAAILWVAQSTETDYQYNLSL